MTHPDTLAHTLACLERIARVHARAAFAHSFGAEDMVLHHLIATQGLAIECFSLDTGRLPEETYTLMAEVAARYPSHPVRIYAPDADEVEAYVAQHGINGFYAGVEQRKACCAVRKLGPLKRALAGRSAWITGLRREQSPTRTDMAEEEWDTAHGLAKFNPLLAWTTDDVWAYIRAHDIPYNALHDRHYPSIGCAPCTRAIAVGEDIRAGRWWWEQSDSKECGLHRR